jgi:hypothetical protein
LLNYLHLSELTKETSFQIFPVHVGKLKNRLKVIVRKKEKSKTPYFAGLQQIEVVGCLACLLSPSDNGEGAIKFRLSGHLSERRMGDGGA